MPHKDPEARRAYRKQYRLDHLEEITAKNKAYTKAHPEKHAVYQKKWDAANRDKCRANHRKWAKAHPEYWRRKRQVRRAQKKHAPRNDLTHAQWLTIQEAQDHTCVYCGKRFRWRLTQDHITPLSQGGSHTLHNIVGACSRCNASKQDRPAPKPVQPLLL